MNEDLDIFLAKSDDDGAIDLSVGEPRFLAELTKKLYKVDEKPTPKDPKIWEYPEPFGYRPLVDFLERKHKAKVVITSGAKQGLAASFYALSKHNKKTIGMKLPFWPLIPPLAQIHKLDPLPIEDIYDYNKYDCFLAVSPNNPDGSIIPEQFFNELKSKEIPVIHDAAYYDQVYIPSLETPKPLGDLQVFTFSKLYGLSGLRIGYIVCHNKAYYKDLLWYMETMTVGVSNMSQAIILELLETEDKNIQTKNQFIQEAQNELFDCKLKFLRFANRDVFEISETDWNAPGMFGWFKLKDQQALDRAKVTAIDGDLFGGPGMVRVSFGVGGETISEVIKRLRK